MADDPQRTDLDDFETEPPHRDSFEQSDQDESAREQRRREERRAVEEAGGGESEGFELAEAELIDHASHGDQHSTFRILRDAESDTEAETEDQDGEYGEPDEEHLRD